MSVRTTVKSIQDIMRQDAGVDGDAQRISQLCWMFFLKILDDQDAQLELMESGYTSPLPDELRWATWAADPEGMTGDELLGFINLTLFPKLKALAAVGTQAQRQRVVRAVFEDAYNYMKSGQLLRQVINKINEVDFNNLADRQHFGDVYEQLLNDLQSAGNAGEYYTPRAVTTFMAERIDPKPGEIILDPACGTGGFLTCSLRHMRDRLREDSEGRTADAAVAPPPSKRSPCRTCSVRQTCCYTGSKTRALFVTTTRSARPYVSYGAQDRVDIVLTNPPFGGKEEPGIESNFPSHLQTRETADLFLALIIRLLKPGGRAAVVLPDGSLFGEGVKTRLKGATDGGMQPPHNRPAPQLRLQALRIHRYQPSLLREGGSRPKRRGTTSTGYLRGKKAYSMTKPIRVEAPSGVRRLVGRERAAGTSRDRTRVEGLD